MPPSTSPATGKVAKQRHSKSCKRCTRRKQRCHGFPVCRACEEARVPCEPSAYAIQLHGEAAAPSAAVQRIQVLETRLAGALAELAAVRQQQQQQQQRQEQTPLPQPPPQTQSQTPQHTPYPDPNPFLVDREMPLLFGDADASTLMGGGGGRHTGQHPQHVEQNGSVQPTVEQMVQATVWSKGLFSVGDGGQPLPPVPPSPMSLMSPLPQMPQMAQMPLSFTVPSFQPQSEETQQIQTQQQHPHRPPPPHPPPLPPLPSDAMGCRMLDAYFAKIHPRYPFLDRDHLFLLHKRAQQHDAAPPPSSPGLARRFDVFRLNMVYAIGGTLLKITDPLCEAQAETYLGVALRDVAVVQDAQSLSTLLCIEGLLLLVLYNLRAPTNTGIWYLTNLAMQTCIDLRMHLEAAYHDAALSPAQARTMRRLFWSAYVLDRFIALSFKRPFSIAENDIETHIPDDDDAEPMWRRFIQIKRLESRIQTDVYGLGEPHAVRRARLGPLLRAVDAWGASLDVDGDAASASPQLTCAERVYLRLQWHAAVAQLLRPFLSVLPADDPLLARCLHAAGHVCALFRAMHMRDAYGHSFVSAHLTFLTGVTMCYCLFRASSAGRLGRLLDHRVAHHLRACSSTMFIIAERYHRLRRHRDILEDIIGRIMDARMQEGQGQEGRDGGEGQEGQEEGEGREAAGWPSTLAEPADASGGHRRATALGRTADVTNADAARPQFSQLDLVAVQSLLDLAAQQEPPATCTSPAASTRAAATVTATATATATPEGSANTYSDPHQPASAMLPYSWPTLDLYATGAWDVDRYSLEMLGRMISSGGGQIRSL
ncbi:hypothetical protein HMPREF1624_02628 [Sporothrix schenckii ATCC 58251]|uniref:Zn(2)-C6 fungal-type domain-containing protein n=1 Tax=Sporothrix schenckii (strain ATCC 58251 / de Perez 2211183) TaxID=1391915 RepID=U7Q2K8_SPOS1|nr:hypothetical protein HMPREF1624_02628 [Sporothrix schenckii ATCC 58251]